MFVLRATAHFRTSDTFNNNVNWGSITKPGEPRPDDTENVDMAVKPLNIGSDQAVTCQLRLQPGLRLIIKEEEVSDEEEHLEPS